MNGDTPNAASALAASALPFSRDGQRLPLPADTGRPEGETLAERQQRLHTLIRLQREQLAAQWEQLDPTGARLDAGLAQIDAGFAKVRRLRSHPIVMALLALSATRLLRGRARRGLLPSLRFGTRLLTRAATAASVWRALRGR